MKSPFALALVLLLTGPALAAAAKLNVVATLPDLGSIALAIGGDRIKVTTLAKGTEDPHFVDARPSFARVLNQADLLLEGGAELEVGWLPPLLNSARNSRILPGASGHLALSRGVQLRDVPSGPIDRSLGDVHPAGNPHYLLDPANGKIVAASITEALRRLDPGNQQFYQENLTKFDSRLDAKLAEWTRAMEPFRGTKVITYHKSFDYFLNRFGLILLGTLEPKPGIEPSPTHLGALIPQAKEAGVKLVMIEPNRPRKTPAYVAEAIGAKVLTLPGAVGGAEKAGDYLALFDYNVAQITEMLKATK